MIYEPREDSFLLSGLVKRLAWGKVLDMGCGSGILTEAALEKAEHVVGLDINPKAVEHCRKSIKSDKVEFFVSNLFEAVKNRKFDLIVFNPPYLPDHPDVKDSALDGGRLGYELIERFLKQAKAFLERKGKILLLFSSLTKKDRVNHIIRKQGYSFECIATQKLDFETLYVYRIGTEA